MFGDVKQEGESSPVDIAQAGRVM